MIQFLDKIGVTVISLNFGLGGKMHDEECATKLISLDKRKLSCDSSEIVDKTK